MSDVVDQGGDPACWAHLFDEPADEHVEHLVDAMVISDRHGTIVQWNAAAEAILSRPSSGERFPCQPHAEREEHDGGADSDGPLG